MAQKSMTKRGHITVEQQIRWHCIIKSIWEEQARLDLPSVLWHPLCAHLMYNVDETGVMTSEGTVNIIDDADQKKHQKNMDDNCNHISKLSGLAMLWVKVVCLYFWSKKKNMDVHALKNLEKRGAQTGSTIIIIPSAYMPDEAWKNLVSFS